MVMCVSLTLKSYACNPHCVRLTMMAFSANNRFTSIKCCHFDSPLMCNFSGWNYFMTSISCYGCFWSTSKSDHEHIHTDGNFYTEVNFQIVWIFFLALPCLCTWSDWMTYPFGFSYSTWFACDGISCRHNELSKHRREMRIIWWNGFLSFTYENIF